MPGDDRGPWPLGLPPRLARPLPRLMQALTIRRDEYGLPRDALRTDTIPAPRLGPADAGRVLVSILATGPNFNTNFAALGLPVPVFGRGDAASVHVPGSDALGIVVDAGPAVTGFRPGEAVILDSWTGRNIRGYETHDGFNAQFAVVDADRAVPLPDPLRRFPPERLAALLLTYGTAYRAIVERLRVGPADAILVMGGGKGTSFAGIQIAKALGARVILMGSNPALAKDLIRRGMADAFVDRRKIPARVFGPVPPGESFREWSRRTEPFRRAVTRANRGRLVDAIFEHTGGGNFPLLVSTLARGGNLVFFGATGKGLKGEYKETFFYEGRRYAFDARWVWMRQKQILFRRGTPEEIFEAIGLPPGRRGMIWGADGHARRFAKAALARGAELAVVASWSRERRGIEGLKALGIPASRILDRDLFTLPADMPDPLTEAGRPNPEYASAFTANAQALGKALWGIFGPRTSPDFVVERTDQSTLHFSTFVVRDFDEINVMPCGFVVAAGKSDLSILGSHMYGGAQAREVVRLLGAGRLVMEEGDLEVVGLPELPLLQQKMLDGTMTKPKGVALVQADRSGRPVAEYEDLFLGERLRDPDPGKGRFLGIRVVDGIAVATLARPDALNALNMELLDQLAAAVRELGAKRTLDGTPVDALVLMGAGRAFVAGADVREFHGKTAAEIAALAAKNIHLFSEIESLPVPVVALVDGFALGGGNELAMSAHYRIATENARFGQPEVKLGIIPGYGGMQRLPRLVGPARAAELVANGEAVDGSMAAAIGLADEFRSSATALARAVEVAREFASGSRPLRRRDWDGLAARWKGELAELFARADVRDLLGAPTPEGTSASDLRAARRAAAREALRAMERGFALGFAEGLSADARSFGEVSASPAGQEWIRRFLAKDAAQSSFLRLIASPVDAGAPIAKKAPGDRQLSTEEIAKTCALIASRATEGKVSPLPPASLKELLAPLRTRPVPPILERLYPGKAKGMIDRVRRLLEKGEIAVSVVDLGESTGFPREKARPACEVLLFRRDGEFAWPARKGISPGGGESPTIFITAALLARARARPTLLLQTLIHPVFEWICGLPHMVAVLCEAAYNAEPAGGPGEVSDLNRFIAEEAGRDRDAAYFDRILGAPYEPDEFRMEELGARFGADEGKIAEVVGAARELGRNYRGLVERIVAGTREDATRERLAAARKALDEGDADGALVILRPLQSSPETPEPARKEAGTLIGLAVESYAHDVDPGYEGLRLEAGAVQAEPRAGRKARSLSELLADAVACVREHGGTILENDEGGNGSDPLGERSAPRSIHVAAELERPSAKFIDGHDRVHWVFERAFVDALLAGREGGAHRRAIPAILACRFVRDGAFPDEKLKLDRQYSAAVRGALAGYRFYQSLPAEVRDEMAAFYEASGMADPLYRLFVSLGGEANYARASHLIRRNVARTHSFNYVRFPDTSLAGQVVVITGGGTGMGRALALEAAIRGANVVVTGRRPAPLAETKADMDDVIRHLGLTNQTLVVQGDASDPKYVGEMFERIEAEFGRIDVLYNNAGVSGPVEFGSVYREEHFDEYREAIAIHLTGAWLASLEAARIMESQREGGTIVMVGTFYSESIHRHVLHAYPGRLPYTVAQSGKLALGDYLAWTLAGKNVTVFSMNPSAVSTERIRRGSGVFDKGSRARARIGRRVSPETLEKDTLERTVGREFVHPRDFARVALGMRERPFRRTLGGHRLPMGGVTYEQPPGVIPSPALITRNPDMVGKVALVTVHRPLAGDMPLLGAAARALARSGANVVLAGSRPEELEKVTLEINAAGGEGMSTVSHVSLSNPAEVQRLFDGLPRVDLLLHFTGSVDWKRPLPNLPFEEWSLAVEQFGYVVRLLCWQAERRMDRDGIDGTIAVVGPDGSGIPSIRERLLVQVFQAMLRPATATEAMERALMRKASAEGTAPGPASDVNVALILPGRTDGRNRNADPAALAATVLWLLGEGKRVSGAVLLPDEQNATARLPDEPRETSGTMAGKVAVVTGGIRNLGKEISLRFAGERATVIVASRRPRPDVSAAGEAAEKARADLAAGDAVLARIRDLGGRSIWVDADVASPRRVKALIDETRNRFGRVDAFVNNAGAGGDFSLVGDVLREHRPSWEAVLRSNFLGPWVAIAALREAMRKQERGGTIVNISTHYADHPYLFRTIYTVSKILLKALTLALREPLGRENVHIADVAPSLIAGPRMDWVMSNFAGKFAGQFDAVPDVGAALRGTLRDLFVRSFDRTLAPGARTNAERAFLEAVRESRLPRARRDELAAWYGRIRDWFARTVPAVPPTNEEVADAVLHAAKNARFLEDRFLGVSSLLPFEPFGEAAPPRKEAPAGRAFVVVGAGRTGIAPAGASPAEGDLPGALADAIARAGGRVTAVVEDPGARGRVAVTRPAADAGRGGARRPPERMERELDLGDPRVVEPWIDSSLLGGPPPDGAVIFVGTTGAPRPILSFSPEEMEAFLAHLGKGLNAWAEAARAIRPGGHVILVAPGADSEEGILVRAALRQIARTAIAEQFFLPWGKSVRVSLLAAERADGGTGVVGRIMEILSGQSPPEVAPVPVGRPRA